MESGAFRCSEKAAPLSIACERSEVLTALQCRALQLYAVFWGMRHKNVKHRSKTTNGIHHAGGAVQQRSLAGNPRKFRESRTRTMGECGGDGGNPKIRRHLSPLPQAAEEGAMTIHYVRRFAMRSYVELYRFFHDRWDIARHVLDAYPDPQYRAEEAFYCFLTTAFASLINDEIPWDDLHTRWTIADVLLEAVVNLVPEAVEEVSE
jgi:hypothetical protein